MYKNELYKFDYKSINTNRIKLEIAIQIYFNLSFITAKSFLFCMHNYQDKRETNYI